MTFNEVKLGLQQTYQLVDFVDLQEYDQLPTGKLYTRLQKMHKDAFADNERIVFIAPVTLKRSFSDEPCDILIVLQKYIQQHDIPHFFIIVVSNIQSIEHDLDYVHKKYNPKEVDAITIVRQWDN